MADQGGTLPPLPDQATMEAVARYAGDVWLPDHPYFAEAEKVIDPIWHGLLEPQLRDCDFRCVLDLATGHGRNAVKLLRLVPAKGRLILADIRPESIAACRRRFGNDPRLEYHITNGWTLPGISTNRVTLFYCFDAMVHFDSDVVRAYLREARRVMAPGARAFLHHSNHTATDDWKVAPHNRAFMSAELFAHYARKEGLRVLSQLVHDWGGVPGLDCFTHLAKD